MDLKYNIKKSWFAFQQKYGLITQLKLTSKLLVFFLAVWLICSVLTILSQWAFTENFQGSPFQTKYLKYFWPVIIDLVSGYDISVFDLNLVSKIITIIGTIIGVIIFAVFYGQIVSMCIHVQQRDGQNGLSPMSSKSHKLKIQLILASKLLLIFLTVWLIGSILTILSQWALSDNFQGSPFQTKYLEYFWPVIINMVSGYEMHGAKLHLVSNIIVIIVVITEIIIFAVFNGQIVSMFIHVQQRDGQNGLSSKSNVMQSIERKIEQIKKVLSLFTKNKIPGLDVNHCYCWDNQDSFVSVNNPIDTFFKFSSLDQVQHVRLIPLLILPRKNNKTGALELLFKKHKDWEYIFPSLEIINHTSISKSELESEITDRLREVINVGSISNIVYLGGVMSFKKSSTNVEGNCYIFPFYVLRGTLTEDDIEDLAKGGKFFAYLSKGAIESIKDIFTMPNGDVYRALERLYSGWGSFWKYVYEYDVALSFAGEDRGYVEKVADELKEKGVSVFYDKFEEENLWGKDLYTYLSTIYHNKAAHTIIFISEHYKRKLWTNHERKSAQARSFSENEDYILPARFDDTEIPGILPTKGYIDLRGKSPSQLTELVCKKINHV